MGVPKFFRYISERYPCLCELVREYQIPEFDNLYLDMNGIIHMCSHPDDFDPHFRITEEKIFSDIFHYIEVLFRMIKPQKLFFMAVDGVAPRAKMNQQRGRRFRSAKDAEVLEQKAKEKGEALPTEARFDSNCITPGTVFMARLHEQLKYFVQSKISNDTTWQKCKVILSGHETPGEGEHKIMDYIRYMKSEPGYDPNTRHCLYGLDADLIMLGLCTHEPHFSLLREEVRFGRKAKRKNTPEHITFYLLHLSLMREYLELEFMPLKKSLPFEYDMEKIIDDWVLMGFLVGNDFIPHLPNLHIASGALPLLYNAYMKVLPNLGGYINEGGTLNLERFEKFMTALSAIDMEAFSEQYADLKYFQSKTGRKMCGISPKRQPKTETKNKDLADLIKATDDLLLEPESGWNSKVTNACEIVLENLIDFGEPSTKNDPIKDLIGDELGKALIDVTEEDIRENNEQNNNVQLVEPSNSNLDDLASSTTDGIEEVELSPFFSDDGMDSDESDEFMEVEFIQHKTDYYMNKLDYIQVTPEVMRSQAEGYVRAIQWNLNYYYNGCCSWSWYYPHHYAPYTSDIKEFADLKLEYDMGKPFLPFEQLLGVLPAASKTLLPEPYRDLMTSDNSSIIQYYPVDFKTDLNGKKQEWEAVVLIPFIAEDLLLKAMKPCNEKLTDDERKRNSHGPMLIYEYSAQPLGIVEAPDYFPVIAKNHAKVIPVTMEEIRVPIEKLIKGPCVGAITDTYFPGFPTFKHLKYSGYLDKCKVRVFDQPSQNDNMIIRIDEDVSDDLMKAAEELLGKRVFVSWPHLIEALVVGISNRNLRINYSNPNVTEVNDPRLFATQVEASEQYYKDRLGIELGNIQILVHVKGYCGERYVYTSTKNILLEKQWTRAESNYPLQAIVRSLSVSVSSREIYTNIQELFPIDSTIFMLGTPFYGCQGKVLDNITLKNGRLKVSLIESTEPDFESVKKLAQVQRYMPAHVAASKLSITPHLMSRITGSIFVVEKDQDDKKGRVNIGLNLKLNKKNEEIPGYTRKQEGQWVYSTRVIDLVRDYMNKFQNVFEFIQANVGNDVYNETELFPEDDDVKLKDVTIWLKEQPYSSIEKQPVGSHMLDPEIVKKIEETVDKFQTKCKENILQVKPHLLYTPEAQIGYLIPDSTATFELYDRVVNVREGYTVPFGCRGTIIGIQITNEKSDRSGAGLGDDMEVMYDVVFDHEFVGGLQLNCSSQRGYRLPKPTLINLSHGLRILSQKMKVNVQVNQQPKNLQQLSVNQRKNLQQQQQQPGRQQSAFAGNWNQQRFNPPQPGWPQMPLMRPPIMPPQQQQQQPTASMQFQQFFHEMQRREQMKNSNVAPMAPHPNVMNPNVRMPPSRPVIRNDVPPFPAYPIQQQQPHVTGTQLYIKQQQPSFQQHQPQQKLPNPQSQFRQPQLLNQPRTLLQQPRPPLLPQPPQPLLPQPQPLLPQPQQQHPQHQQQQLQLKPQLQQPPHQQQAVIDETEVLKKLLKIPGKKNPVANNIIQRNKVTNQATTNSVEVFFAQHAKYNLDKKVNDSNYSKLFTYCHQHGFGTPKFNFIPSSNNMFKAQAVIDGHEATGEEASTKQEATENAAKLLYTELQNKSSAPNPTMSQFPNPPKQWCKANNQGPFVPLQAVRGRGRLGNNIENMVVGNKTSVNVPPDVQLNNRQNLNSNKSKPRKSRIAANFTNAPPSKK